MEVFPFVMHLYSTDYPESGNRLQLGNAYTYASEPTGPDQRVITLSFAAMQYFEVTVEGVTSVSPLPNPTYNLLALELFYRAHRLWKSFLYNHPIYGQMVVKFNKPLKVPEGIAMGNGVSKGFSVELIEMP